MHGQIGDIRDLPYRSDLDFYYRTRASLIEARRLGGGTIDYDFYRMGARAERGHLRRETFRSLLRYVRPLIAVALLAATIFMMLKASDCPACDGPARPYKSMHQNLYLNY